MPTHPPLSPESLYRSNLSKPTPYPPSQPMHALLLRNQASDNWTRVTFTPDLAKFGMTELEADTVALMRKRVYDMAGILGKGVKVVPMR